MGQMIEGSSVRKRSPDSLVRNQTEIAKALRAAARMCADGSRRLTPIRRDVYELLLKERRPMSAYELLSALERSLFWVFLHTF